jgi:hypothetical protein
MANMMSSTSSRLEDFQSGDDSNIASLSSEFYSRRLCLAFGMLPVMICMVASTICTMFFSVFARPFSALVFIVQGYPLLCTLRSPSV